MTALNSQWKVQSEGGGSWGIISVNGDIIASEIPHGAVADHIVEIHNRNVRRKADSKVCDECIHFKHRHDERGCHGLLISGQLCDCKKVHKEIA